MAGRQLNVHWVLHLLCVLLMGTVSRAGGLSMGTHTIPEFPASGLNQTLVVDVSIHAGSWHRRGVGYIHPIITYLLSIYFVPGTELVPGIYQATTGTKILVFMELTVSWEDR